MRPSAGDYQVGHAKPPRHTRFHPGVSGNLRGRPRGTSAGRGDRLALKEIYRLITVREGEQTLVMPTVQAVMRQLGRIALKGNGPALRTYLQIVQAVEERAAMQAAVETPDKPQMPVAERSASQRIHGVYEQSQTSRPMNPYKYACTRQKGFPSIPDLFALIYVHGAFKPRQHERINAGSLVRILFAPPGSPRELRWFPGFPYPATC
jgi:hypothetical protein